MTLGLELPADVPFVSADIGLVQRVLENVIDNAIKHTPEGGQVTVTVRREVDRVVVEVSDTGPGISPQELPHVFERFYRADQSRSTPGSGLGLAIAKKILDLHQSTIEAISTVGSGTTFRFQLPVHR